METGMVIARRTTDEEPSRGFEDLQDLPLTRPTVPAPDDLAVDIAKILESGVLTNGPYVRAFEHAAAERLGVRYCVAVSSCTAGLMLVLRASDLSGDVILPSFTFAATAHAVAWNGLRPVFADVDKETLTLSREAVAQALGVRTSAIFATHVYGAPCDIEGLSNLAQSHGIKLFFDAAHALGSLHDEMPVGRFGDAEVFSLSPTKLLVAGEGGLISTNDDLLAERCRIGRDYANPGDYDCQFVGLNARMSEFHAAMALATLDGLEDRVLRRNALAARYRGALSQIPGIGFVSPGTGDRSTFKDFTITVDPAAFGVDSRGLGRALDAVGIETRRYYDPPVHEMRAYRSLGTRGRLPVTESYARRVLTLPMWSEMPDWAPDRVADAIHRIYERAIKEGTRREE
jgi:dTDP-4-amino-4,6-dideoxygalactose transaminase